MKVPGGNLARDVYRDLRDRRLLSIAIVLVVAIVAVPFLLESDADPRDSTATVTMAPVEGVEALEPVVVSESSELRDYKRRLDQFQKQNPFAQQMAVSEGGTLGANADPTATAEDVSGAGLGAGGSIDTTELDPVESADPVDETDPVDEEPVEDPGTVLYTTSIDVRVGPVGKTKVARKVDELEFLPDPSTPVVQHLYADLDESGAAFVVSPAVVDSEGDGRCEPSPQACQFLLLDVGEEQRFVYDDGVTYRLELLEVDLHEDLYEDGLPIGEEASERDGNFAAGREPGDLTGD